MPHFDNLARNFLNVALPTEFLITDTDNIRLLGRADVESLMLERPPFCSIERAVALNDITVWAIATMSPDRVVGHFPGSPVVPLIELCKAMAQAGNIVAALQGDGTKAPIAIGAGESKALAKGLIYADEPTDILIKVHLVDKRHGVFFNVDGTVYVGGKPIGSLAKINYILLDRKKILRH